MTTLSQDEINRYSRHLILPEVGPKGQETLKNSSVLVIGAGGLGCPLLQYLAAAGVGRIGIVDFDTVDVSNLQRQILFSTTDVGRPKVDVAKERILGLNPHIKVETYQEPLTSENALQIFQNYDVVADGTDNFPTRYLVNDACVLTNKPNVYGSIFRFEGQVTVFNYEEGPNYRDLYSEPPPPGLVPSCAEGGVLGILPGVVATLQATEVIKVLLKLGDVASGRLIIYDALKMVFRQLKVRKHGGYEIKELIDYKEFCGIPQQEASTNEEAEIKEITVHEYKTLRQEGQEHQLIDVREPHEYDIVNIAGSELKPLNTIQQYFDELDKSQKYIVHCKMGGRSAKAVRQMKAAGFTDVTNLIGGITKWVEEVDPSLPSY